MAKILLVEDDKHLLENLATMLQEQGYTVEGSANGNEAREKLDYFKYDLVILDWNLPGKDGVTILDEFRNAGGQTPVLMLTGRGETEQKTEGLDKGADDYLVKPFQALELLARVRALLRRPISFTGCVLKVGNVTLHVDERRVCRDGTDVELLPLEYKVLEFLMRHESQTFSAQALLERVWRSDSDAGEDAVRTLVKTLRRKIAGGDGSSIIRTVYGVGYKASAS